MGWGMGFFMAPCPIVVLLLMAQLLDALDMQSLMAPLSHRVAKTLRCPPTSGQR